MGKKRKATGQPFGEPKAKTVDHGSSKLVLNSYTDVADSGDEFELGRDSILIDETPAQKLRRKLQEQSSCIYSVDELWLTLIVDEFFELSDEEVFANSSKESETDEDDGEDREGVDDTVAESDEQERASSGARGRRHTSTHDGEGSDTSKRSDEDEYAGVWGTSKTDYYNADQIETEADALEEEAEAIRLQKKQLQKMTDADFGFDEIDWLDSGDGDNTDSHDRGGIVREVLPQLEIADDVGPEQRTKLLYARYPEFHYLAQEYTALQVKYDELHERSLEGLSLQSHLRGQAQDTLGQVMPKSVSIIALKKQALSSYLGAISMYFALLLAVRDQNEDSKRMAMNPNELHDHPVMEFLLSCRNSWELTKEIIEPELVEIVPNQIPLLKDEPSLRPESDSKAAPASNPEVKKPRTSKAQKAYNAAVARARAERAARIQRAEEDLKKLYSNSSTKPSMQFDEAPHPLDDSIIINEDDSDFGEATHLNEYDAEEKAKRKKSLQFYTSQIAQKASRRGIASRNAGGDDDIPYKERLKDRQERLNKEAEARGRKGRDTTVLANGMDDSSMDEDQAHMISKQPQASDDEYYDQMISRPAAAKAAKKAEKAAAYQATLAAEAEANGDRVVAVEQIGPDGKRAIGYTIEKNKGLAPHRKKDVRNPRVKKRKKFEEKKKKQRNMRPVWKGGEGKGGYGGELTGIKKGIIRSIKL